MIWEREKAHWLAMRARISAWFAEKQPNSLTEPSRQTPQTAPHHMLFWIKIQPQPAQGSSPPATLPPSAGWGELSDWGLCKGSTFWFAWVKPLGCFWINFEVEVLLARGGLCWGLGFRGFGALRGASGGFGGWLWAGGGVVIFLNSLPFHG